MVQIKLSPAVFKRKKMPYIHNLVALLNLFHLINSETIGFHRSRMRSVIERI